jgi:hypothetical protein
MSARAVSEARAVCEARALKRENSSNTMYRKKKVSFSNIINIKILYPDTETHPDADDSPLEDAQICTSSARDMDKSDTLSDVESDYPPIIARDIKKTSDIVSTNQENAEKFARNLVDVILQHAKYFQTNTVYLP